MLYYLVAVEKKSDDIQAVTVYLEQPSEIDKALFLEELKVDKELGCVGLDLLIFDNLVTIPRYYIFGNNLTSQQYLDEEKFLEEVMLESRNETNSSPT